MIFPQSPGAKRPTEVIQADLAYLFVTHEALASETSLKTS